MKSCLLFIALILPMLSSWASQQSLATFSDPSGDDYGYGTLVYPQRTDFQVGDLDLLQLKISRDEEGFWFEATFKNAIRDPAGVPNSVGAESLATFARRGFYQFNVDVYVDTDRIKGSGNTFTASGRQVVLDPAYAWEKAVILTPRPELMRQQLLDVLAEQYPERSKAETEASVDQSMYFPTRVRIRGKSIAFFVPAGFFSGSDGTDWAVTTLVTGAIVTIPADLSFLSAGKAPLERLALGAMQPLAGHPVDTFGYSGAMPSPVVDLLGPSAEQQATQLSAKVALTGVSWGLHAANDITAPTAMHNMPAAVELKPASLTTEKPVVPIGHLLQPKNSGAVQPPNIVAPESSHAESIPAEAMPQDNSPIAMRLKTLQQLFNQKLIDESEYRQQKQRILNEL